MLYREKSNLSVPNVNGNSSRQSGLMQLPASSKHIWLSKCLRLNAPNIAAPTQASFNPPPPPDSERYITFHRFTELAAEIRLKIWNYTFPEPKPSQSPIMSMIKDSVASATSTVTKIKAAGLSLNLLLALQRSESAKNRGTRRLRTVDMRLFTWIMTLPNIAGSISRRIRSS